MRRTAFAVVVTLLAVSSVALANDANPADRPTSGAATADTTPTVAEPAQALGLEARSPSRPAALPPLYVGLTSLQAFDVYSTLRALKGGAQELNPHMRRLV